MTPARQRSNIAGVVTGCCAALAIFVSPALGQSSDGEATTLASAQYHFTVAIPSECRHEEGPGTIDALCPTDAEPNGMRTESRRLSAFVLQVSAQTVPEDAGKSAQELADRYTEAMFKEELPGAVCGESDNTRAKLQNVKAVREETRVVYAADIVCSSVRFLQVPERTASVRYILDPAGRYRLIARSASSDFQKEIPKIEAFFSSFAITPAKK
jgi:hypothetical protein